MPRNLTTRPARAVRLCMSVALFALSALPTHAAKPHPPELRFELGKLGYPGISQRLLDQGGTLLTVHFAGDNHILLTFASRGLLTRLPQDRPGDEDRLVAAELLELPTGRIVARTEWRLHDHGRYLWSLGRGRFLLRVQDSLSTFNPVANLASGHAFDRTTFAPVPERIDAVVVTADHELVTVESSHLQPHPSAARVKAAATIAALAARPHFATDAHAAPPPQPFIPAAAPSPEAPVITPVETYRMYHITGEGNAADPIEARSLGRLTAASTVALPLFYDGYLKDSGQGRNTFNVDFHSFAGKDYMFSPIESSCQPSIYRVAPAQFVSVNCRGVSGDIILAAYDLAQHEMWEEPLPVSLGDAAFVTAPAAGRFAISRIVATAAEQPPPQQFSGPSFPNSRYPGATYPTTAPTPVPDAVTTNSQEVRVYQTQSGDLLLKVECTPAFKALENFDLSPDGLRAVVIRQGAVEVHRLPPMTRRDKDDVAVLTAIAPKPNGPTFDLRGYAGTSEEIADPTSSAVAPTAPLPPNANIVHYGDVPTTRQPPSLLEGDEKPEFADPSKAPQ